MPVFVAQAFLPVFVPLILADRSGNRNDSPHDYVELEKPAEARYVRLNIRTPGSGTFSVRDLRIFGNGGGSKPSAPRDLAVERDGRDPRNAVPTLGGGARRGRLYCPLRNLFRRSYIRITKSVASQSSRSIV